MNLTQYIHFRTSPVFGMLDVSIAINQLFQRLQHLLMVCDVLSNCVSMESALARNSY